MSVAVLKDRFKCTFQKSGNTSDSVADEMAQAVAEYLGPGKTEYVHNQGSPATTWTIVHNLGRPVTSVMVTDSAGTVCLGEIQHQDQNTTILKFGAQFAGKAVLF